jgi:predicted secreted protein
MRPFLALALLAAVPALAQPAPPAETVLRLSETAEVKRAPDEIRAELRAEARAGTAAAAQAAVNRAVAAAVERARSVPEVRATTGGYWTHRTQEPAGWQAAQVVALRATEAAPLLELAGQLQQSGLALAGLAWTLSDEAERTARAEATRLAIDGLRRRAEAVAAQLGMSVAGIRELRLDAPRHPPPRPVAMAAMARGASAPPPPVSVPEEATVSATAEADVVLTPRR